MRISDWSSDVCSSDLPHRAQNMADLARPAATRAAERKGDMASIGHQAEAVHALAPDIEISVITAIRIAVERPFGEQVQRKRPEPLDMLNVLVEVRSEEHTSELQSLMRITYDVF